MIQVTGDHRSDDGHRFLLALGDRLRPLTEPTDILRTAGEMLGRHLGVNRAGYAEVEADRTLVIGHDWVDGVKHGTGRRPIDSFGAGMVGALDRGETLRIESLDDPWVAGPSRAAMDEMSIVAAVTVPLVKGGRLVGMLSVHQNSPRVWTDEEVRLVEEVAERTWSAMERARAEARLRDSEAQLHMLADNMSQLAWIADGTGSVFWYNRRWYDYTGATFEQLKGDGWADFVDPAATPQARARAAEAFAAGLAFEMVVPFRRADGVYRPFLTRVQPMRSPDGRVVRWFGTNTDIGDQLEAERSRSFLLALEDRLRPLKEPVDILQTVSEAIGRHVGANRAGYSEVDETGEYFVVDRTWTDGTMPDSVGRHPIRAFGPDIIAALERGVTFVCEDVRTDPRLEEPYRAAYLGLGIVSLVTKPLLKGGKLVAIMTINHGQPYHWPEAEVRLIEEVAERTWATLARARAEANLARSRDTLHQSEKLTALGALLAGVSHELNNPLSVVIGQAFLLEEETEGSALAERAGKIRRAAERCGKIVQTFLALARQNPPSRARVDAAHLVRGALELTEYGLRTAGVKVETVLEPDLPPLSADADQLHQVVANLLINAQHALADAPHPRRLTVAARRGRLPGTVEIEVGDNGPGVAAEVRRRIFEPFFTTKPQGQGTGLGLSFSHGVVEAHGGRIDLLDAEPGAVFRLTLPAVDGAVPRAFAKPAEAGVSGRALVVDDEPEIADMLAELLRRQGYEVRVAAGGGAGRAALEKGDFDLILSDLRMPDLDGPALYAWLQGARPELSGRIGFVTGDTLGGAAARFLAECGRPCLEKPFTPQAVRGFVERLRASVPAEA